MGCNPPGYEEASDAVGVDWSPRLGTVVWSRVRPVPISPWKADELVREHLRHWEYTDDEDAHDG